MKVCMGFLIGTFACKAGPKACFLVVDHIFRRHTWFDIRFIIHPFTD